MSYKREETTILIVDDNPVNLEVLMEYLDSTGFNVLIAEDGESAIERASFTAPDIILLDILMPAVDGFEVCRRLKSNKETSNIPVIFMTALTDKDSKLTGFEAGAVDFITKPFQQEEVLARLDVHLTLQHLQRDLNEKNIALEREIVERKKVETEREKLIAELREALDTVKTLKGLLPMCSHCKKIRNDDGTWQSVDHYIEAKSDAEVTHGMCPTCLADSYPEYWTKIKDKLL